MNLLTVTFTSILLSSSAYTQELVLSQGEEMSLSEISKSKTEVISCEPSDKAKCILMGKKVGILYPWMQPKDIEFTKTMSAKAAIERISTLKRKRLCH
jgi:hypothetical protein